MTLREYFKQSLEDFGDNIMPSFVMYHWFKEDEGSDDGYKIDDFKITDSELILENDFVFSLDSVGDIDEGIFVFEYKGDIIGIEFCF